jgi:enediyne biosynthesis protein E4
MKKYFGIIAILMISCSSKNNIKSEIFEVLDSKTTGINFNNKLTATPNFNMFKYMYFYNGAGVGAGDFNNDGLVDLFFASNQQQNKLYINKGGIKFEDVTTKAQIPDDGAWSTGVSVVDINNDGMLDIYVCRVGNYESLQSNNQFLICKEIKNGVPVFKDEAREMGVAFSGFSTQSAFLDYDNDGDLDMYLMNHSLRYNGTFNPRDSYINTTDSLSGDYLFKNDNGKFVDVTKQSGISSTIISYGLGICVSDINLDGYPDIYIGNDFHENDYLYINQKNGTFKETLQTAAMHTSQFSMGVDIADVNNDAFPEIITMDMMPQDPYILKRSLDEDGYDLFNYKRSYGYMPQFAKNALQYNNGNGMFSEVAMYSNVFATDWSWSALWMDFDNDGLKDLFVSNGIPKRLNDIDYVNYVSNGELQDKIRANTLEQKDMLLVEKFPQIKLPNKFYRNKGELKFEDVEQQIKNDVPTYSNGAIYADLDNDGDLDIVVNNIDDDVLVYKNNSSNTNHFAQLKLQGNEKNINGVGSKVILFAKDNISTFEKNQARGFQSSMEIPLHISWGNHKIDSAVLVWFDNSYQKIDLINDTILTIQYKKDLPKFNYSSLLSNKKSTVSFSNSTASASLQYLHQENKFNEFDREQLMPRMVSREGPSVAVADVNGDGLDDVFLGAAKGYKPQIFIQNTNGKFSLQKQQALDVDSIYEDVDATFVDVDNDKDLDLLVASGGNEYFGNSIYLQPRLYVNDGKGFFTRKLNAFPTNVLLTASSVSTNDFNGDGFVDVFLGARALPWEYGATPTSFLLQNNGDGVFKISQLEGVSNIQKIGLVTSAVWADLNNDRKKELIVACEWDGVFAFEFSNKTISKKQLTGKKGWWSFCKVDDINNDGLQDIIVGNLGENNRLNATDKTPVKLYLNDFDDNGKKEQLVTYYLKGKEILFANKDEFQRQMPSAKKKYLYAEDFAKANVSDMFASNKFSDAKQLNANYFSNSILINKGNFSFNLQPMPWEAQLSTLRSAAIQDVNNDGLKDILVVGNFYPNNIQMSTNDANYGGVLINKGNALFKYENFNGLIIKGEARKILPITINKKQSFLVARNNDSTIVFDFKK